jgi:hypothetical protein
MFTAECVYYRDTYTQTQISAPGSALVDSSILLSPVQSATVR